MELARGSVRGTKGLAGKVPLPGSEAQGDQSREAEVTGILSLALVLKVDDQGKARGEPPGQCGTGGAWHNSL